MNNSTRVTVSTKTIDALIDIEQAKKVVTERQATIVYVKQLKQFYWLDEEKKEYVRLKVYET